MGYFQYLKQNKHYRHLWCGTVSSFLGDWFNTIALYTAAQELSQDARSIALVMVAKTLPPFLVIPIAGPLVDRFDRRKLLLIADFLRCAGALGLCLSVRGESLISLYLITVTMTALGGLAFSAKAAALPQLVKEEDLALANALGGGTWSVMLALGATFGGVAVATLGIEGALLIDATTFIVSALFFRILPALPAQAANKTGARFREVLSYLKEHPYIASLLAVKPALGLLGGAVILLPFFGSQAFPEARGPLWVGILYGMRGVGCVIGALWLRHITGDTRQALRYFIGWGFAWIGLSYGLLAYLRSFWGVGFAYLLAGIGASAIWVFVGTLLQLESDKRFHGRIFSMEFGLNTLCLAASSWLIGTWVEHGVDLFTLGSWMGVFAFMPMALWFLALVKLKLPK
jgi:MFS family permease